MIKIFLISLVAVLTAAMPAHAGPVVAAIGAVAGWIGSLGAVGQFIVGTVLSVGVSLIQKALTKSSTSDTAAETGVTLSVQMG
ncbi:hypothetical protein, partial [Martelella sp. HB161492]|uniref:hypothetical protein n=1 Tax=Martelella sp. HB161492 TaxID=2720726 RepID=UPI001590B471